MSVTLQQTEQGNPHSSLILDSDLFKDVQRACEPNQSLQPLVSGMALTHVWPTRRPNVRLLKKAQIVHNIILSKVMLLFSLAALK